MGSSIIFLGLVVFFSGVSILFLSLKLSLSDTAMILAIIISVLMLSAGTYLIFMSLTWYQILKKLIGSLILIIGYFLIFLYPGESDYQPKGYTMLGVITGILFFIIGIYLLIF